MSNKIAARKSAQLKCVRLEPRRLLSGTVVASLFGDVLQLWGDQEDNQIEITQDGEDLVVAGFADTQIEFEGQSQSSVTLDGAASSLSNLVGFFDSGDDSFVIRPGFRFDGHVAIFMQSGNDSVGFDQSEIARGSHIDLGTGNDELALRDSAVDRRFSVLGLSGDDTIGIDNSSFESTSFVLGSGNDSFSIEASNFDRSVFVFGHSGSDDIAISDTLIGSDLFVFAGSGSDLVSVNGSEVDDAFLFMGSGDDIVEVDQNANSFFVFGGSGNDEVTANTQGTRLTRSVESTTQPSDVQTRIDQSDGLVVRVEQAFTVFDPPDSVGPLTLELQSSAPVIESNDLLLTDLSIFAASGETAANASIE